MNLPIRPGHDILGVGHWSKDCSLIEPLCLISMIIPILKTRYLMLDMGYRSQKVLRAGIHSLPIPMLLSWMILTIKGRWISNRQIWSHDS